MLEIFCVTAAILLFLALALGLAVLVWMFPSIIKSKYNHTVGRPHQKITRLNTLHEQLMRASENAAKSPTFDLIEETLQGLNTRKGTLWLSPVEFREMRDLGMDRYKWLKVKYSPHVFPGSFELDLPNNGAVQRIRVNEKEITYSNQPNNA